MASSPVAAARKVVEKFRARELQGLRYHRTRFGSLPPLEKNKTLDAKALQLPNPFVPRLNPKTGRWADPKYSLRRQAELVKKAKASGLLHLLPPGPKTPVLDPAQEKVKKFSPAFAAIALEAFKVQEQKHPKRPALFWRANESWTAGEVEAKGAECWGVPVNWEGKVDLTEKAGAELGIRLYAGKKRMFKGHKWERVKASRDKKRSILLRDMPQRIAAYKAYYKKRKPNPLKPPRTLKSPKLPF